ncbi:hypothetical protein DV736_g5394, partial [Chaetothyriales sp. CBS 134916]
MALLKPSNLLSCCWRCIAAEIRPAAQSQSRRSLVTLQRGPVQKLDLPPAVPPTFWSQLPARLRPDRRKREIVVHKRPASEREACKEPIKLVDLQQLSRLDPTGARSKLFDPANEHRAKPGDILLTTFTNGLSFAGIVVAVKGSGPHKSMLLRNHLTRIGTEMLIKIHSPLVQSIEIAKRGIKRRKRAKLYYLRQPKHDIGSVQATAKINQTETTHTLHTSHTTCSDQTASHAETDKEASRPSLAADTDTSHVSEPQDIKLAGERPDFLTSEPIRVTFKDNSTVFYVQKEIMRRFLGSEAEMHSRVDQGEIQLGAVHPGVIGTLIRAFYSPNPHQVDLDLPSLSPSGVLEIYAAATKVSHHQWIRIACLKELETRPILLTELIVEFQVLYDNGQADREARDMFKRITARELDRGWPIDFLSQFLASVSHKGGELVADLVEAVVNKCLLEDSGSIQQCSPLACPVSEAIKVMENDSESRLDPVWWRRAGTSDARALVAPMAEDGDSSDRVCLGPATDCLQPARKWRYNEPSMTSVVRARSASEAGNAAWSFTTESREARQDTFEREQSLQDPGISHGNDGPTHGRAVVSSPSWTQVVPQLPATSATSLPPFNPPSGSPDSERVRSRVTFSSGQCSQTQVDPVAAPLNQHERIQRPFPMPPPPAFPYPGEDLIGMPHYVPKLGYNRVVSIGNGMIHPTSTGVYGLAGRAMVAKRDSGFDCTLFFQAGDIISNVVSVPPSFHAHRRDTDAKHIHLHPWTGPSNMPLSTSSPGVIAHLQGICRGRAGQFPSSTQSLQADFKVADQNG